MNGTTSSSSNFILNQFKEEFSWKNLQIALAELIGTFFLTFYVSATKISNSTGAAPYAIGIGLVVLVYTFSQISGGQLNPAVTLGLLVRGKLTLHEAYHCWGAQFSGALLAGLVCYAMYGDKWDQIGYPSVHDPDLQLHAMCGEMLQTFALVSVVLNTATTRAQEGNSYFGLAIGFVVLSGALVVGNITGACFNPALSVLTLLHGDYADVWVFVLGPLLGAAFAGLVFRVTNPGEWDQENDPVVDVVRRVVPGFHVNPDEGFVRMAAKLAQEWVGTFYLTYTVALTTNSSTVVGGNVAVGAMLTAMVYSGGAISGGHYNPCVTLGLFLRGQLVKSKGALPLLDTALYVVVQVAAAFAAGACAAYVNDGWASIAAPHINLLDCSDFGAMFAEFLFSYLLVLAVLCCATVAKVEGNGYFGLAIGLVVVSGGVTIGDFSGGCFNPAVAIALPLLKSAGISGIGWYVFGELLGSVAAVGTFAFLYYGQNPDEL